jgi:hypothetical protein
MSKNNGNCRYHDSSLLGYQKPVYHPVRLKGEYLRESAQWYREQQKKELWLRLFAVLVFLSAVAILSGWPCADAVCAPAG